MIDWKMTLEKFKIEKLDISVKKRPKLVAICGDCNKRIDRKVRALKELDDDYEFLCRKCAMNRPSTKKKVHEATAKSNREREYSKSTREKMSKNSKEKWKDENYRKNLLKKMSIRSKKQWKEPEFRKFMSDISKKRWENKEYREKITKSLIDGRTNNKKVSRLQETLYSMLDDLDIKYFRERNDGPDDNECKIGPYSFDCVIPMDNKTLLIECQGDYWHSLEKTKSKDKRKLSYISNNFLNHEIKYLWEHEFHEKNRILELLKYWIGISKIQVVDFNFTDILIKECPSSDYRPLLEKYHYLSRSNRGGISYGAYLNNELVAVCSFSSLVRQNLPWNRETTRELSRLCIHPKYQKKNFASWFVSRCIKKLNPKYKTIISYCDTTFNHDGATYKACNFKLDGEVNSSYWYVSDGGWVMHKKTLYNKAVGLSMKEREYAEKFGYRKVKGKKKLRFIFER